MTIDEQIEILQAAKNSEPIEFKHIDDTDWHEFYLTRGYCFNFDTMLYRIKPKEKEQGKVVKTEIKWGENNWKTKAPFGANAVVWVLGSIDCGYCLIGFEFEWNRDKQRPDINNTPIETWFDWKEQKYHSRKATHALWQKEE